MRRRDLLTAAGASLAALAAPRIGRAESANKLVFVPTEDLGALDPVVAPIRSTRNHASLARTNMRSIICSWLPRGCPPTPAREARFVRTMTAIPRRCRPCRAFDPCRGERRRC